MAQRSAIPALRRLWQVPAFLAGVLAVLGVWLARPLWRTAAAHDPEPDLAALRQRFEEPAADAQQLVAAGRQLLPQVAAQRAGEVHFLLGTALVRLAQQAAAAEARESWQEARKHLEEAERLGVSASDQARLRYRLAKVWLRTGGEKSRIVAYLNQALGFGADDRVEALALLTQAHLLAPADRQAALEANGKLLAQPTADERVLAPARLVRGELYAQLRQYDKAVEFLLLVNRDVSTQVRAQARALLAHCYQETEAWAKAADVLEQTLADREQPPAEPGRLAYELGMCCRRLPERREQAETAWKRALTHGGSHAQAAALRLAELAVHEKGPSEALAYFRQALQNVERPEDYGNPLIPLAEVVALLERAAVQAREGGTFADARELARLTAKLAPSSQSDALLASVASAWAGALRAKDAGQARRLFEEAGQAYERAGAAPGGTPEHLFQSAECYRQAGVFAAQVRTLEQVITRAGLSPERLSEAWFRLGEVREALGLKEPAKAAYGECVQRGGVHEDRARYQLAALEIAAGKVEVAILQLTLNASLLGQKSEDTRDREVYEKTLITLGDLLMRQGQPATYSDALSKYTQALASLGNTPAAWPVHFKMGECYWKIAAYLKDSSTRDPKTQGIWETRRLSNLKWAEETFERIEREMLGFEKAGGRLTAEQEGMRRELGFRIAGARLERGEFEQALPLYLDLARSRTGTLDGLIALEGAALCHHRRDRTQEVQETLDRIRAALQTVPAAAFTGQSPREHRRYWEVELQQQLR